LLVLWESSAIAIDEPGVLVATETMIVAVGTIDADARFHPAILVGAAKYHFLPGTGIALGRGAPLAGEAHPKGKFLAGRPNRGVSGHFVFVQTHRGRCAWLVGLAAAAAQTDEGKQIVDWITRYPAVHLVQWGVVVVDVVVLVVVNGPRRRFALVERKYACVGRERCRSDSKQRTSAQ
jgi:hypothetical protein